MASVTANNPNATLAATSTGIATIVTWLVSLTSWNVPAAVAVAAAGLFTSFLLFIGRNGLKGAARLVWRGPAPPTPPVG